MHKKYFLFLNARNSVACAIINFFSTHATLSDYTIFLHRYPDHQATQRTPARIRWAAASRGRAGVGRGSAGTCEDRNYHDRVTVLRGGRSRGPSVFVRVKLGGGVWADLCSHKRYKLMLLHDRNSFIEAILHHSQLPVFRTIVHLVFLFFLCFLFLNSLHYT